MAVDLGLSYIKVAVARPGKGLELVTNEQSKRKTPAAVGFTDEGERLFGDAAVAYAAKAPHRVILDGRDLIGECAEGEQPGPFCARRTLKLDSLSPFTGEEVVAMLLAMAKRQASAFLGGAPIKDVAVTVPAWYDERQRLAIMDAAKVIGLNCLGVVNANTAAAIKYALDGKAKPTDDAIAAAKAKDKKKRTPKTLTQRVLFYDIGASSASASIAEVTSDVKTKVASGIKMLGHAWEKDIGGRMLDAIIVERLADAFDKQRGEGAKPSREIPRVMQRLRKEAQKVKEMLSANTEAFVSVASLHDDTDFKTSLMRADFEKDARSMFSLVAGPAKAVLSEVKLRTSDLDAVVPFGGVSRIPRVQSELSNALGISTLNKSINTDEAAVMGSVFFAASLSSTFRVRKLEFEDVYTRVITAEIEKEGTSGGFLSGKGKKSTQKVDIFPLGAAKMPSKKTLSLNRNKDFGLEIYLGLDSTGKTRYPERTLYSKVQVSGVADVLKKLKDTSKAKNLTPRVALTFHVDRSGFIRIGTAESSIDETVVVEREVEIEEKTNSTTDKKEKGTGVDGAGTSSNEKSSVETESNETSVDAEKESKSSEQERAGENDSDDKNSRAKNKKEKKKKTKLEKSTQTIVHRHALKIEYTEGEGLMGTYMSGKELNDAKQVLKDLEKADIERVERADAFNALEGFILEIRSKVRSLDEDDDLYKVSTVEEREKLIQAFEEGEDWMYTEEAKQTANLRTKHFELQKLYEPMQTRAKELLGRGEAFKALGEGLDLALEKAEEIRALHVERNSTKVDAIDKFKVFCETAKAWITEKQEEQSKKELTEVPVVTVKDILEKGAELRKEVEKIARLEIPPAPKVSPTASEGTANEGKAKVDETSPNEDSDNVKSESTSENVNSTAPEAPVDEKEEPSEPDSDGPKVDAASGVSGKDEL